MPRWKTSRCPALLVATPAISPMFTPAGGLRKSAESKVISGADCAGGSSCACATPGMSKSAAKVDMAPDFSLAREWRIRFALPNSDFLADRPLHIFGLPLVSGSFARSIKGNALANASRPFPAFVCLWLVVAPEQFECASAP